MNLSPALLMLLAVAPLASASVILDPVPVCVFDPSLWEQSLGNVCVDVDFAPLCVTAWGYVASQHVYADVTTPGRSFVTRPVDAGPVHVGSTSVTLDPVHVATVDEWTPARGFTNTFCTTSILA